jgi:hypothetical protein
MRRMLRRQDGGWSGGAIIVTITAAAFALGGDSSASPKQLAGDGPQLGNINWISPRPDGLAAAGGYAGGGAVSADGSYVAFGSTATNIVLGPAPFHAQAYLRDVVAGTTRRISVSADGAPADGDTWPLDLSRDGRWALLGSTASNLAEDDPPGYDLFLADTMTGEILPIPRGSTPGDVANATMDGFGRLVAFAVLGEPGPPAVGLYDRETGVTEMVAPGQYDRQPHAIDGVHVALSGDGRWLTFSSDAPAGVHVGQGLRPWLLDTDTRTFHGLGFPPGIIGDPRAVPVAISDDGERILVVGGSASWDGETNTASTLYLYETATQVYSPIPIPPRPSGLPSAIYDGVLSPDGKLVAFFSQVANPDPSGSGEVEDTVIYDTATGETTRPLRTFLGHLFSAPAIPWAFSADNRFLLFSSDLNYIHPADHNGASDVYLFELEGEPASLPFRTRIPGIAWGEAPFVAH